ncbi:MAG TPA: carboxypeptidase regulatory-like domain-containing protein [Thermoanaerobaculia bacterium]|nr:carboxypeptidase regulatory-like domain-containing protein [Thermoanaerobaculia bacterium]
MRARLLSCIVIFASIPAFAAITGTVINPDGQAVAGAKVSAFSLESLEARRTRVMSADPVRKPLGTTQTDSKGNFSIDAPKSSVVDLRFEAAGFAPQSERAAADDDAGVIQLMPSQMKQGTITANGKPVAGAKVLVAGEYGELLSTTDATGHYSLPDPARTGSRIVVQHPDYAVYQQLIGRVTASKGVDIALDGGTSFSGKVVAEDGQTPVANAGVFVDDIWVTKSADDGTFTIAHLPKKFDALEAHIDNRLATRPFSKDIKSPLTLKLAKGASLTGTVRDAKTQAPLAGAEVRLIAPRAIVVAGGITAISDAKGNYAIAGINGGDYDIVTSRPNYGMVNVSVHIPSGQTAQKALYGTPLGRISGTVMNEDKQGIGGAHIEERQASNEPGMNMTRMRIMDRARPSLTAPDGRFMIRLDTESDVQLEATKRGMPNARSSTLKVAAGERKSGVVITLPRGIVLEGRVIDSKGKPIAGVAVGAMETRNNQGGGAANIRRMIINNIMRGPDEDVVRTGADGRFTMRVKEGTYDVGFKREGYAGKTLRAQQVSASSKPVEVTLDPGVEVTGRVTRGGQPVEGVNVIPIGGDSMLPVQTLPDGTFRISDLAPGEMMIAFSKREEFIQMNRAVNAPANDVNIDLPPGGRISGHVVDKSTHSPVKSFEAGIIPMRSGGGMVMMMAPSMQNITSDDGSFTLENVPLGSLTLAVNAPGYVQTRVPNLTLDNGKAIENVEVALETGVRVTGHVTGPDSSPAGGAVVRIDAMAGGRAMRGGGMNDPYTTTDPGGEYTLENVEPGEKTLVFSRSGLISTSKTVDLSGDHIQVDAQLTSGAHAAGLVVNDGGTPIADAQVRAQSAADPGFGRGVRSDSNGSFSFDGLAPGHYQFSASKDGYAEAIMRDVDVTANDLVRLTLRSGGTITGHVTGLSDTELQNATVYASSPNGNASAPVDSSGNYHIDGAPIGTVRVNARAGQMTSSRTAPAKAVQVDAGVAVTVDFDFTGDISIKGRVTRNGSEPVAGAMVMFNGVGRNERVSTDSSGRYEVRGLDNGRYSVTVVDPARGTYATSYTVDGSANFDIDVHGTTVRGRVADSATGQALQDVMVTISRTDSGTGGGGFFGGTPSSTDAGGNFSFDTVPAGSYKATADKSGYGGVTVNFAVTDNGAEPVEIKLTPTPGVLLRVVDARDNAPLNARYHAVSAADSSVMDNGFVRMMASSTEPIRINLTPGVWHVTVNAQGYAQQTVDVVSPGDKIVRLTPGGTIVVSSTDASATRGRLLDANGQTYEGFTPVLDPLQATVSNVAPGVYTLQLLDSKNNVVKSQQVTMADGQTITLRM